MSQQYQAANPNDLILHPLDSMSLIFHKPSGITHVVADLVPAILEVMGGGSMVVEDVVIKLSENFDLEEGVDVEKIVLARLIEMSDLGLIERIDD